MEIVEVRGKSKSFDSSLDVLLNVRGRVGDTSIATEDSDTAFRGNCWRRKSLENDVQVVSRIYNLLKTLSRTLCFLMKSPSSFSLTPAW